MTEPQQLLQLLPEYPPGYGGVERVAHELAQSYGGITLSLVAASSDPDPLPVCYQRRSWKVLQVGRLKLPLPKPEPLKLLWSRNYSLLLHLPCPSILMLGWLVKLLQPKREIHLYWHAFLDQRHWWFRAYEFFALCLARQASTVTTTSPRLLHILAVGGISRSSLLMVPPALPQNLEASLLQVSSLNSVPPLRVLCLGRLDSYKRQTWLIQAVAAVPEARLTIVGSGPHRSSLERLGEDLGLMTSGRLRFLGRVSERDKLEALAESQVLVLPADSSHEAFGIVQLEAMAAGRVALSMHQHRSGTAWVNGLTLEPYHPFRTQDDLVTVLQRLSSEPELLQKCGHQARMRYQQVFSRAQWHCRCRPFQNRLGLRPYPSVL